VEGFFWLPLEAMGAWPTAGIDSISRISLRSQDAFAEARMWFRESRPGARSSGV